MELPELKEKLRASNLYPIHVEVGIGESSRNSFTFSGSLEEYFEAVKALGKPAVFIKTQEVDEDDFLYDPSNSPIDYSDDENYDDEEDEADEIDLCLINPDFKKFKDKINSICIFKLSSSMSDESLDFYIEEKWWEEYMVLYRDTIGNILQNKMATKQKLIAAKQARDKELLKSVRELWHDKEFVKMRTQRAMSAYAIEKIPDLENIDPSLLRKEIQTLYDKVRG